MILVVAAVIVDDLTNPTRLLATRRSTAGTLAGGWEFPGGKVEPDEDPTAALHREVAEELQITIDLGAELRNPAGGTWPISAEYELRLWFAILRSGRPTPTGSHDELRWLAGSQLGTVDWLPADKAIIALLSDRLMRSVHERHLSARADRQPITPERRG